MDEDQPMLPRAQTKYNIFLTWWAAALWVFFFLSISVVFLVLYVTKGGDDSADDIIARYSLTGHDLIGGGHFREIVRTHNMTIIYYLQQHHDATLHRVYNGSAEEGVVWVAGSNAVINDNGDLITIGKSAPAHVVKHTGSNWLDYNIVSGWCLMTVTFIPPFDPTKLSVTVAVPS